jgi:hypothetical protein
MPEPTPVDADDVQVQLVGRQLLWRDEHEPTTRRRQLGIIDRRQPEPEQSSALRPVGTHREHHRFTLLVDGRVDDAASVWRPRRVVPDRRDLAARRVLSRVHDV